MMMRSLVSIKSPEAIGHMTLAGKVVYDALCAVKAAVRPGVTTMELDEIAEKVIKDAGAVPSFKGYNGFPGSICASVDGEVVHGIPSRKRALKEGQIISIDCGAIVNGYHGDSALTVPVGEISQDAALLIKRTEKAFWLACKVIRDGARLYDIGHAVQSYVESFGYGVVRELTGHGIGRDMHEEPSIPNYGVAGTGMRLREGMTIAVEPMITMGSPKVLLGADGWVVSTKDKSMASHYEHTLLVTKGDPVILTLPDEISEGKKKDFQDE